MSNVQTINCIYSLKPMYYVCKIFNLQLLPLKISSISSCSQFAEQIICFLMFSAIFLYVAINTTIRLIAYLAGTTITNAVDITCIWFYFLGFIVISARARIYRDKILKILRYLENLDVPSELCIKERNNNIKKILIMYLSTICLHISSNEFYMYTESPGSLFYFLGYTTVDTFTNSLALVLGAYGTLFQKLIANVNMNISNLQHEQFDMDKLLKLCNVHFELKNLLMDFLKLTTLHIMLYVVITFAYLLNTAGYLCIMMQLGIKESRSLLVMCSKWFLLNIWKISYIIWTFNSAKTEVYM